MKLTKVDGDPFAGEAPTNLTKVNGDPFATNENESTPSLSFPWHSSPRAVLQGLTLGASDELGAGVAAGAAGLKGTGDEWGDMINPAPIYNDMHQLLADERKAYIKENPGLALALQMLGGVASGGMAASKMLASKAMQNIGPLAKLMAVGGTEGGIYGTMAADQGKRIKGGAIGAGVGTVAAPVMQLGGSGARALGRVVGPRIKHAFTGSPGRDARRELATILSREGVDNLDELATQGGRLNKTLADVSEGAKTAAASIAEDVENPAIAKISNTFLKSRNKDLTKRALSSLDEALDLPSNITVRDAVKSVGKAKKEAADRLYGAASKIPYKPSKYVQTMLSKDGPEEVQKAFSKAIKQTNTARSAGEEVGHFALIDQLKKNLDDQIMVHMRAGSKNAAKNLIKVKNNILKDLDSQNPAYKEARDTFAGHSALEDAAERGSQLFKDNVDDLADFIGGLSASERKMHLFGVKQAVRDKLMAGREGTMTLNRISSQSNLEKLKTAFPSEKSYNSFVREIDDEAAAFETYRLISQGSKTAKLSAARQNLGKPSSQPIEGINPYEVATRGITRLLGSGLSREAKEELGRMILTPIKDLPPNLRADLSKRIVKGVSKQNQKQVSTWFDDLAQGAYSPASGAIIAPIATQHQ